jgi:hypothetical protein
MLWTDMDLIISCADLLDGGKWTDRVDGYGDDFHHISDSRLQWISSVDGFGVPWDGIFAMTFSA